MARIFFVLPEVDEPIGGNHVTMSFAAILKDEGLDVAILYSSKDYYYPFFENHSIPTVFVPNHSKVSLRQRTRKLVQRPKLTSFVATRKGKNSQVSIGQDDVVIFPEFNYKHERRRIPNGRHVLLCQGFGPLFSGAIDLGPERETAYGRLTATIAISEICAEAVRIYTGTDPSIVPISLDSRRYRYHEDKQKKIVFMPRRRRQELTGIVSLLASEPALKNYEFVALDRVSASTVDQVLSESLIFLSGSQQDGFGLPPAEAMAMGCLAIGYAGVGGEEFFTETVGFPVPEDNTVAFYRTIIDVVEQYETDPSSLNRKRKLASETILSRYTKEETTKQLLKFCHTLDL